MKTYVGDCFRRRFKKNSLLIGLILTLMISFAYHGVAQTYYAASNQLRGAELQSKVTHQYGKIEFRMYSNYKLGTTSTYFWWRDNGQVCGTQWNELDIETLPLSQCYQSNPIWEQSDADCAKELWEAKHGDIGLYGRWVTYQMEWAPDHIAWFHDGIQDRYIALGAGANPVLYINKAMKNCFNMWSQGSQSPNWLGNLDFDALQNKPIYMFVDYFKYFPYNGAGFDANATVSIDFNSAADITNNFNVSNWAMSESKGYLTWSQNAVGVVDIGGGNSAMWMCVAMVGQERAPVGAEIPGGTVTPPVYTTVTLPGTVQAENYSAYNNAQPTQMTVATTDVGGGNKMGYNDPGDWYEYSVNVPAAGNYTVDFRVANGATTTGQFTLTSGVTNLTTVDVAPTGGWEAFVTITKPISFTTTGVQTIRLSTIASGVDYNWFSIAMPVNAAPTATLTAPANNSSFTAPATIALTADASDTDGTISKVEFYDGATLLGTDTSSPYSYSWTNVAAGAHSITAKAYDNLNASTSSAARTVTVVTPVLTSIAVSPSTSTVDKGTAVDFNATGYDQLGNVMANSITEGWTTTGGGTINSSTGILTTNAAGTFTVSCSNMTGGTEVFTDPSFTNGLTSWTVQAFNGAVGTTTAAAGIVSRSVTTAGTADWNYRLWQASNLTVQTYTYEIRIRSVTTPRNVLLIAETNGAPYTAYLSSVQTVPTAWTVYTMPFNVTNAENIRVGIYDGATTGSIEIDYISLKTAATAGVTGTTTLTVNETAPVLTTIAFTTSPASTTAGTNATFAAQGYDQSGIAMAVPITYSVSAGATISATGVFSSTTVGTFTVTATSGTVTGTSSVAVTAAALSTITLDPVTTTKTAGQTQQYVAAGKDAYNNTVAITPAWTVTGGGTINASGLFSATTVGGPFTVTATSGTISGTAQVTVTAGALSAITLTPATVTVTAGQTQQYAAAGKDAYNNAVTITPTWTVSGGGTISATGLFSATTAGAFTVTVTSGTVSGTTQVTVAAGALSTITLTPATITVTAGQTQQYVAAGKDAYNNTVAITPAWTVTGGGTINASGLFSATTVGGPFTVTATSGTISGTAQVTVTAGALSAITLTPATVTVTAGQTQQYAAAGKDAYNNAVTITPTWTVSGGGTISATGLFSATTAGAFTVTATSGTVSGTTQVTVAAGALNTITLTPATATKTAGQTQQYVAAGKDAYNNTVAITPVWTVTGGGTINASGLFTATTVGGPFTVTATSGTVSATAQVTVTAGALSVITLTPATASKTAGTTQQYVAAGKDAYNNTVAVTPAWTVSGGGTISTSGLFSATTVGGPFTVTATSGTVSGTAQVSVTAGALSTITLTPAGASKTVGTTQQYAAAGKDAYNNAVTITPTWTVSGGGTISAGGLFSATTAGGPFTVTATSGTITGTTTVTVTAVSGIAIPGILQAEAYTVQSGGLTNSGTTIGGVDPGDWAEYAINVATAGTYTFKFRVASTLATGTCTIHIDGGASLGTFTAPNNGSWTVYADAPVINIVLPAGAHTLRLNFTNWAFNTDFIDIQQLVVTTNTVAFNPPAVVESGDPYAITVNYTSTGPNEVQAALFTNAFGWVVGQTQQVAAGSGTLTFNLTIPAATAVGNTYIWQTEIRPVGGTWQQRYNLAEKLNVQVTNLKSATVGIDEPEVGDAVVVYPSPVSSILHLDGVEGFTKITIYNSVGQLVKQVQKGTEVLFNIDVQSLKNGMYFIELSNGTERISKRIIKN